jgi:hypothetical protein
MGKPKSEMGARPHRDGFMTIPELEEVSVSQLDYSQA